MISRIFMVLSAVLVLAGCSGGEPAAQSAAAPQTAQSTTPAPAAQRSEPVQLAQAEQAPAPAARPSRSVDLGERRFREGAHYELLSPQQPTSTEGDQVEVAEVFMYSCPHCYTFEPYLEQWAASKADYINLVRIPAAWNALAELHARAFYTAEVLGKGEEMHAPFFREFHVNRNYLDTEAKLADFFGEFGVDEETFTKTFNSFAVHTKVQRAKDLVQRYRVTGTPGVVVEGKYITSGTLAQSYETWFDIINELAAVEYAAKSK